MTTETRLDVAQVVRKMISEHLHLPMERIREDTTFKSLAVHTTQLSILLYNLEVRFGFDSILNKLRFATFRRERVESYRLKEW